MPANQLWRNLTTDTLHFVVHNASLWSGVQFYVIPSLVTLLNFIASQLLTVWLQIHATFWSGKTMVTVSVLYVNLTSCRVGFVFSCNYRSKISLVVRMVQLFCQTELWPCTLLERAHHSDWKFLFSYWLHVLKKQPIVACGFRSSYVWKMSTHKVVAYSF